MLFKVFHRTLEFNLLLSISLITASFLAFFNKWYYFASSSIKRHSLDSPLFELFLEPIALFDRCENFSRKPRWFLHRFNSDWFKCSVSIFHIEYKGFLFLDFMLVILTVSFKFPKYLSQTFRAPFIPVNPHVCFHFFVRRINHRYRFQILMAMSSSLLVS